MRNRFWILDHFPLPPTLNHIYPTGAHGRRFKNTKHWDQAVFAWSTTRSRVLENARREILPLMHRAFLKIDKIIAMPAVARKNSMWHKNGKIRKWDADNRTKPVHDALSGLIGIEDCLFRDGGIEKAYGDDDMEPHIIMKLSVEPIRSVQDAIDEWIKD